MCAPRNPVAIIAISSSKEMNADEPNQNVQSSSEAWKVYKLRWYVLFVVTFVNISGGLVWISLSHVSEEAIEYYNLEDSDYVDLLTLSFFATVVLLGFHAMMVLDKKNLKFGIRLGTSLLFGGCLIRALATFSHFRREPHQKAAYYITLVGQLIAGCGQPFIQFTPSKVAEHWFPENQRVIATTVIGMGTPLGLAIGSIMPPYLVRGDPEKLTLLTWLLCAPCALSMLMVACVRHSKPPSPPSSSAAVSSRRPFWPGIKHLLTQKAFVILLIYVGSVFGFFLALVALIEDMFSAINSKFNDVTCGFSACLLVGGGVFGAFAAAVVADRYKTRRITIMKLSVAISTMLSTVLFTIVHLHGVDSVTLAKVYVPILCWLVGFFGYMNYPLGLDLGVECAFPVASEATCNGLMIISGNLQGALYMVVMLAMQTIDINSSVKLPYFASLTTQMIIMTIIASVFILFFYTEYNRMRSDVRQIFETAINTPSDQRGIITSQPPSIYS